MALYAVIWKYTDDKARIAAAKDPHIDYIKKMVKAGVLLEAGGWRDGSGALLVFKVADRAALQPWLNNDPFTTDGVIVSTEVHDWNVVVGPLAAS